MKAFEPVRPYPKIELLLVVIVLPTIINAVYFWVCDSFLMQKPEASGEDEEEAKGPGREPETEEDALNVENLAVEEQDATQTTDGGGAVTVDRTPPAALAVVSIASSSRFT